MDKKIFLLIILFLVSVKIINLFFPYKIIMIFFIFILFYFLYKNKKYLKMISFSWIEKSKIVKATFEIIIYTFIALFISFFLEYLAGLNNNVFDILSKEREFIRVITSFNIKSIEIPFFEMDNTFINTMDYILSLLILPIMAIYEEVLFRGVIYGLLKKHFKINIIISVLITSILFTLFHLRFTYMGIIDLIIVSAFFNYIYIRKQNLLYPIIVHLLYNIFGFFVVVLSILN
jgi:hypothetical protein